MYYLKNENFSRSRKINSWVPLMMEGRQSDEAIAVTYDETGTDVNFGALTKKLIANLQQKCWH